MDGRRPLLSNDTGRITYLGRPSNLILNAFDLSICDIKDGKTKRVIDLISVIGSKSVSNHDKQNTDSAILEIYNYKVDESFLSSFSKCKLRKCETVLIEFANSAICEQWATAVNCIVQSQTPHNRDSNITEEGEISLLIDSLSSPPASRQFIVFVNPVSGRGDAVSVWESAVKPMLIQAGVQVKLVVTKHSNHAREIMEGNGGIEFPDPSTYDCILVVGGDGVLFEVINGLSFRSRGDGEQVLSTVPVAPIPGGTGNGLAKSLLFESGEDFSVVNAVFLALKGTVEAVDLSLVQTRSKSYKSFLLLGWGLISDIDLLSESLRWMGEMRLYVAAVYFIMRKRFYRGRLSMYTGKRTSSEIEAPPCPASLPSFDCDIKSGDGWEIIDSSFIFVWIVQTSHATASMLSGPGVRSDDGMFTIYIVREISRVEILQLLVGMDTGDHANHPRVETYKCTAYRLEPLGDSDGGLYTLDGEMIEYGPVQGVMCPGSGRVKKFKNCA